MELVRLVSIVVICAAGVICGNSLSFVVICAAGVICGHWWSLVVIFNLL